MHTLLQQKVVVKEHKEKGDTSSLVIHLWVVGNVLCQRTHAAADELVLWMQAPYPTLRLLRVQTMAAPRKVAQFYILPR